MQLFFLFPAPPCLRMRTVRLHATFPRLDSLHQTCSHRFNVNTKTWCFRSHDLPVPRDKHFGSIWRLRKHIARLQSRTVSHDFYIVLYLLNECKNDFFSPHCALKDCLTGLQNILNIQNLQNNILQCFYFNYMRLIYTVCDLCVL